jgi:MFS family permease
VTSTSRRFKAHGLQPTPTAPALAACHACRAGSERAGPSSDAKRLPLFALVASDALSLAGSVLAAVAIPWFVLVTTGTPARTGIAAFFAVPLAVSALLGGAIVDRVGARRASVVADLLARAAIAAIAIGTAIPLLADGIAFVQSGAVVVAFGLRAGFGVHAVGDALLFSTALVLPTIRPVDQERHASGSAIPASETSNAR